MQAKQIAVQKALFIPKIASQKPSIVYLPGFSLGAKSRAVNHLCKFLASKGFFTLAISTTPHSLEKDSLTREASVVINTLQEAIQNPFILVAHSKGASKAIAVVEQLKQKPIAIILVTPVGLYAQSATDLQKLFVKEVKENAIPQIKKEILEKHKPMSKLAVSVVSMAIQEAKIFLKRYPKRLKQEAEELAIIAPQRAQKVLANLHIPIVIGYTKQDKVVNAEKLLASMNQIKKQQQKETIIVEEINQPVTHGLPYTHPEIVEELITRALEKIISN